MRNARSARLSITLLVALSATSQSACGLLTNADNYKTSDPPKSALCDACPIAVGLRRPPCEAEAGEDLTVPSEDKVYAVRRVSFGKPDEYRGAAADSFDRGFDLNCSVSASVKARCTIADQSDWETLPGGVDDAWLTRVLAPVYDTAKKGNKKLDLDAALSREHEKGKLGLVAVLHDYNGMGDDPDVALSLYPSPGTKGNPKWNGGDVWPKSSPLDVAPYLAVREARGYVSGGVLVVDQRDRGRELLRLRRGKAALSLLVGGMFFTARVTSEGLSGLTLSGSLDLGETLANAGAITALFPFCAGPLRDQIDASLPSWVSGAADLPSRDAQSPDEPCGSISFSIRFDAEPAVLGEEQEAKGNDDAGCET